MESTVAYAPSDAPDAPPEVRRLSVNVASDVGDAIDQLAKRHGTTITDVIRRAVSIYKYIDDQTTDGARILIEDKGTIREVKFFW